MDLKSERSIAEINFRRFIAIDAALEEILSNDETVEPEHVINALCYVHNLDRDLFNMISEVRDEEIRQHIQRGLRK